MRGYAASGGDYSAAFFLAEVERFVREQLRRFSELRLELEQQPKKRSGVRRKKTV
jgi:hypothetical protein